MNERQHTSTETPEMIDKYTRALRRMHVGAGFIAGSGLAWLLSEVLTTAPLTFYLAIAGLVVFGVVTLVDAWRLR